MQIKLIGKTFICGTKRCIFKFKNLLAGIRDTISVGTVMRQ